MRRIVKQVSSAPHGPVDLGSCHAPAPAYPAPQLLPVLSTSARWPNFGHRTQKERAVKFGSIFRRMFQENTDGQTLFRRGVGFLLLFHCETLILIQKIALIFTKMLSN